MYRLDLADPRLNLPVAVYRRAGGFALGQSGDSVAFYALARPG